MPIARVVLPAALAGAVLGVVAADGGWLPAATPLPLLLVALGCVAFARSLPAAWVAAAIAALALGMASGMWREHANALPVGPGSVAALVGEQEWQVSGQLAEEPRPKGERIQLILEQIRVARPASARAGAGAGAGTGSRAAGTDWHAVAGRLLLWLPRSDAFVVGDRIALFTRLEAPEDFDGFAYRAYLARQQIGAIATAYEARVVGHRLDPLNEAAASARRWLLDGLDAVVPEPEAALGAGILLGVRSGISPEIGDAFARAGLTHVVAISGWNIAIVAALIAVLLRPLGRRPGGRWLVPAATAAAIGGYVILTGSTPSVVRAALMAAAMLVARLGGSRAHAASALMLAALVMLLAAPPVLWDVGFQLSLLATAGLIWFGRGMELRLARLPGVLREPIALTLAAQLTTLPIVLANFERLSLVAPLANVVVVPLVPLVMLCCAVAAPVGALIGLLHPPLIADLAGWLVGGVAWLYLRLMVVAGSAAASVPFASIDLVAPIWLAAAWYPALLIGTLRVRGRGSRQSEPEVVPLGTAARKPNRRASALVAVLHRLVRLPSLAILTVVVLLAVTLATLPDGRLHLVMLDVGQGDAILIESGDGRTLLIDGGPDPDLVLRRLGEFLPFYRRRIDVVLLTHPHQDHVAGLVEVLRRFEVGLVLDSGRAFDNPTYDRFVALARAEPGGRLVTARAGQHYALGQATFTLLYPSPADAAGPLPDDDINNASVVGVLRFGAFSALLTGDAEAPVEARLLERGLLAPVDVLKVGHHGSRSSSSPGLLDATDPLLALISDGVDNDYGHPAAVTLAALAARAGLITHRTDLEGSIEVISDGRSFGAQSRVARDPRRPTHALARGAPDEPASILAWPSPDSMTLARCSPPSTCPVASSPIPKGWSASPPKPRAWSSAQASRSRFASSRSPPCCTTSTSPRPARRPMSTAWWRPAGSAPWATPSWVCPSRRTRSPACSTRSASRSAGRLSSSRCRTSTWPSAS
jgi:competence protein ComEC